MGLRTLPALRPLQCRDASAFDDDTVNLWKAEDVRKVGLRLVTACNNMALFSTIDQIQPY